MSPTLQTLLALGIVALAATWLVWRAVASRKGGGCGGGDCGAISPEIRKLQAKLKRR
ncbi:FeoB-associated Cys-rich membrane protein [Opitutus sp. ER46]|uniref:FeoB-associated Cys-rich membrane protein n=1 Tax=Opitutus sp. ER46 TaxID=2161864 RepID=UPI000D3163C4|nr:FeoB-associated Cys-rich membrane protein [Opitutus sp. ER46]PTX98472.1 FeoB-associated Cys-rich membrane protein [Opitutus sp. ER46]